MLKYSPPNP
ncbi:hypothetical protein Taro_010242 [Colocasia esculenta]|uniref:Uncharacterized protein n=1 Tax=Colocasia esculenta TaxID=4460 RepID=A0A843U8Z2_COLES|nr:hypothetical protein [Colocasia esculenta]